MLYGLDTRKSPEGDGDQLGMLSGSTIELGHGEIERSLRCKRMRRRRRTRRRRGGPSLWLTWIFPCLHRHSCRPEGMQRPHHLQHHHHYRQRGFATAASSPSQLQKNIFCWGQMIHTRTKKIFSFFFFGPFSVDGMYETFIFCHFFQSNILLAKNHSTKKWQKMHPLSSGERKFPFPVIPKNGSLWFPSRISGMAFFHSLPIPEFREWIFSIPFPFPNWPLQSRESKGKMGDFKRC